MIKDSPLGQKTEYINTYTPGLLYPVPRTLARDKLGLRGPLPFQGVDIWTAFEISWLNPKGKPLIALADLIFPCTSPFIVESKSLKLYLNSFNQSVFESFEAVQQTIKTDLQGATQAPVSVDLYSPGKLAQQGLAPFSGFCLDDLDIETHTYDTEPSFLVAGSEKVTDKVYTDLLKSNCLATGQPDWGSVLIHYQGNKIDRAGLLKYLISFRNHSGFAEHCVEQIFHDISVRCKPECLTVYCRYTRRGGLDINPFRSNFETHTPPNLRQIRQ